MRAKCPVCGTWFDRGSHKPFVYCPEHRGKKGLPFDHTCTERCDRIQAWVALPRPPTLQAIGEKIGLTRERTRQIIKAHGWKKARAGGQQFTCTTCGGKYWGMRGQPEHNQTAEHRQGVQRSHYARGKRTAHWEEIAMIYALWECGEYTNTEIAYLADASQPTLYRWLPRFGINPYRRGPVRRAGRQEAEQRDRQVIHMWMLGVNSEAIMELFDLGEGNFKRIVQKERAKLKEAGA